MSEAVAAVNNLDRIKEINDVLAEIKNNISGDVIVSVFYNQPVSDMSYIEITGHSFEFLNTDDTIIDMCDIADIIEVYPLTDGRARMKVGFYRTLKESE